MLDRFIKFIRQLDAPKERENAADDPRVAAAALMFHVVNADGVLEDGEIARLREMLSDTYDVRGAELDQLIATGEAADREAIDLYAFTSVLKRHLGEEARKEFIGTLWEMVYADGDLHELEDHTVWRVAELIGVSNRDRVELRRKSRDAAGRAAAD